MSPIPTRLVAQDTLFTQPPHPETGTADTQAPSRSLPAILGIISPEQSGVGTLVVNTVSLGLAVAVIWKGIMHWRSSRFSSWLTELLLWEKRIIHRLENATASTTGQGAATNGLDQNVPSTSDPNAPPLTSGTTVPSTSGANVPSTSGQTQSGPGPQNAGAQQQGIPNQPQNRTTLATVPELQNNINKCILQVVAAKVKYDSTPYPWYDESTQELVNRAEKSMNQLRDRIVTAVDVIYPNTAEPVP